MQPTEIIDIIKNVLFAAGDSVSLDQLAEGLEISVQELDAVVDEEIARQEREGDALMIRRLEDRLQMSTNPKYAEYIVKILGNLTGEELSRAMLETLAIIAYRQPVTRAEIEQLRGVNSSYMINALLEKKLICEAGRKEALGRPILYATSEEFLRHFGINSLEALPPIPKAE